MVDKQVDILIVGGGLTGATLLLCLQNLGYETLLVESLPFSDKIHPDFDARTLALAPSSVALFQSLDLWSTMQTQATPVTHIHVSQSGSFGATRLQAELDKPLGYVVEMQYLNQVLLNNIARQKVWAPAQVMSLEGDIVHIQRDEKRITCQAKLIIAADGADSRLRAFSGLSAQVTAYNQSAITCNIALEKPHKGQAFERFTPQGALALLPMHTHQAALVWSLSSSRAADFMQLSDRDFLTSLQTIFGYRLGRMTQSGKRSLWPLRQIIMPQQTAWPLVFIGNAAHTLHPVAAQGFNLGLRDVATLVECIVEQGLQPAMLSSYQDKRRHDQQTIVRSTHLLAELFSSKIPGLQQARHAGLLALDTLPFFKKIFSRYARGFGGHIPDLLCKHNDLTRDES